MVQFDPMLAFLLAVLLGFVFFIYLFLRRTITAFKEGQQGGRER